MNRPSESTEPIASFSIFRAAPYSASFASAVSPNDVALIAEPSELSALKDELAKQGAIDIRLTKYDPWAGPAQLDWWDALVVFAGNAAAWTAISAAFIAFVRKNRNKKISFYDDGILHSADGLSVRELKALLNTIASKRGVPIDEGNEVSAKSDSIPAVSSGGDTTDGP
ncbi:MAG: hypothetical protein QOE37_2257, partial [Microbacteriaceae bacterium]|nr:hypothetical protein [Microbacteriaceae bacterium]